MVPLCTQEKDMGASAKHIAEKEQGRVEYLGLVTEECSILKGVKKSVVIY